MEKKQQGLVMKRQLDVLIDILNNLDDADEDEKIKFRDDYFKKVIEKGYIHGEGTIDFEFKCGIPRSIQAYIRKSPKKKIISEVIVEAINEAIKKPTELADRNYPAT